MKRSLVLAGLALALLAVCTVTVGCDNWEQNVYKTLAATQSAVNNAQAAYEVSSSQPGGVCPVVELVEAVKVRLLLVPTMA